MTLREALDEARLYARVERETQFVWQLSDETWTSASVQSGKKTTIGSASDIYHVDRDGRVSRLKG